MTEVMIYQARSQHACQVVAELARIGSVKAHGLYHKPLTTVTEPKHVSASHAASLCSKGRPFSLN